MGHQINRTGDEKTETGFRNRNRTSRKKIITRSSKVNWKDKLVT